MLGIRFNTTILLFLLITACTSSTQNIASRNAFQQQQIQTAKFNLYSQQKITRIGAPVNIYIEGDGHAWTSRTRISSDPSPHVALVMQLAANDPNPNVVYLARPCQYSPQDLKTVCENKYWSSARYSPIVVQALDQAITAIKQKANAEHINLIGFSGGGTLAVLIAAQRKDISSIRTIAGNLDLNAMEKFHATSPLTESLDPISVAYKVRRIPQLHFVGDKDNVVPVHVVENFSEAAGISKDSIIIVHQATHNQNWQNVWKDLLALKLHQEK